MARVAIEVDRDLLVKCIEEVEAKGPLGTQKEVWEKSATLYNGRTDKQEIAYSTVSLRAKEWKISIKTPSARGRKKGTPMTEAHKEAMLAGRGKRRSKEDKFKESTVAQQALADLRRATPERFLPVLDKVEAGSRAAALKLHCLECSNFQTSEVRKCEITKCAIWLFRPYQGPLEADEDAEEEETNEDNE